MIGAAENRQKQWEWTQNSLPDDISLKIVSLLQVSDVCALGSCSRFLLKLSASNCIWISLCRNRWPSISIPMNDDSPIEFESSLKEWKVFYFKRHSEMFNKATRIVKFIEQCSPSDELEVGDYLKAIENLSSMELEFKDVQMFFFSSKQNVLLNLIALHYSIFWLRIPAKYVNEALWSCKIAERPLCVKWWKLGRWLDGFRLRDESHSRNVCLGDLTMAKAEEVLRVLHRGAVHEVLRVQISVADPTRTPWVCQSMQTQD